MGMLNSDLVEGSVASVALTNGVTVTFRFPWRLTIDAIAVVFSHPASDERRFYPLQNVVELYVGPGDSERQIPVEMG